MSKLYFKYGAMGSSKSAQALITKFNYEELGMTVWLIKPSVDDRDGADIIRSRIGLEQRAQIIKPGESITEAYKKAGRHDLIGYGKNCLVTPENGRNETRAVNGRKSGKAKNNGIRKKKKR